VLSSVPTPGERRGRLARRLLLAAGALLLALLAAEIVLRARLREQAAESDFARVSERFIANPLSIRPKRHEEPAGIDAARVGKAGENVNGQGFRGPAVAAEKPAGTRRVVCLGGSSVYGTGNSSDAAAWPACLQRELSARGPTEVLNGGVPGYQLEQSVARFEEMFVPLHPDVAILCNTFNDVVDSRSQRLGVMEGFGAVEPLSGWRALLAHSALGVLLLAPAQSGGSPPAAPADGAPHEFLKPVATAVQEREALIGVAQQAVALDARRPGGRLDRCFFPQDLRACTAQLERFVELARAHGCEPVLVVEPLAVGPADSEEAWSQRAGVLRGYFPSGAVFADVYGRDAAAIRDVAARRGARCWDAWTEFERGPGRFTDVVHLSDEGAKQFAAGLAAVIGQPAASGRRNHSNPRTVSPRRTSPSWLRTSTVRPASSASDVAFSGSGSPRAVFARKRPMVLASFSIGPASTIWPFSSSTQSV
jgi:lysophospholipase L1-like esterase